MSIRALLFDFGSVLSYSLFEQHAVTEKKLGLAPGSLTWRGPFAPESDFLWQRMQRQDISERDYWAVRAKEVGQLVGQDWDVLDFVRAVRDIKQLIRPELVELIARAKAKGLKVGILSNELELFYGSDLMNQLSLLKQMDTIIDATHTHILKPDPRAYELALAALNVLASEVVFIDDQLRNVKGAEDVGIVAIHFDITRISQSTLAIEQALGWV